MSGLNKGANTGGAVVAILLGAGLGFNLGLSGPAVMGIRHGELWGWSVAVISTVFGGFLAYGLYRLLRRK